MSMAEIYQNGVEPDGVKLWRRDWDNMPDEALLRLKNPDGSHEVVIGLNGGLNGGTGEPQPLGVHRTNAEPVGWYPLPNPDSDAAYDPGEGTG